MKKGTLEYLAWSEANFIRVLQSLGNVTWRKEQLPFLISDLEEWRETARTIMDDDDPNIIASRDIVLAMLDRTIEKVKAQL